MTRIIMYWYFWSLQTKMAAKQQKVLGRRQQQLHVARQQSMIFYPVPFNFISCLFFLIGIVVSIKNEIGLSRLALILLLLNYQYSCYHNVMYFEDLWVSEDEYSPTKPGSENFLIFLIFHGWNFLTFLAREQIDHITKDLVFFRFHFFFYIEFVFLSSNIYRTDLSHQ